MKLSEFLDAKPLYYDEIDYDRMPRTYEAIKEHLKLPKIIHLVGTNGKGTTGRFIANALFRNGMHVGHYTSPHILTFNERIWIDGANVDDATLETAHEALFALLGQERADALSYFEYTTLLAMV
ncbi:MAG: bifunctional folylpolyglutamate synthase/dihydrofolate synthase, partial [Sulfurimonadaceae bacterium]|nr:bifunctional folylpolyglutamate synthase/dihydrofolate synthase [Sulfurimonadaceae bacterium]